METLIKCIPVYIVVDTSWSMHDHEADLNDMLDQLYDKLIYSPAIAEFASVSILSYNTRATVVLEMNQLDAIDALPQLACGGVTNFRALLQLLRERIDEDFPKLRAGGRKVLRPVVFLLTDGHPTDEQGHLSDNWKAEFAALTAPSYGRHPYVVPFGYGAATADLVRQISTDPPGAAFLAKDRETGEALVKILPALLNSLAASASENALILPKEVEGYIRVNEEFPE